MLSAPSPLPENTGLAFTGEAEWLPAVITSAQAKALSIARNPAGRPNRDVLRSYVGQTAKGFREHWQIDFPAHYNEQEAALHEKPFALLRKNTGSRIASDDSTVVQARSRNFEPKETASSGPWWINPHARPPLRHALARLDRYLATALDAVGPEWSWLGSEHWPDASLLVIARDDDFTHAVVQSAAFTTWWRAYFKNQAPAQIIESCPFPWPPATPLGSLTKTQQEIRSTVARAALAGDAEQVNSDVAAAYRWCGHPDKSKILPALHELHRQRINR
jgi:hypothetical protein